MPSFARVSLLAAAACLSACVVDVNVEAWHEAGVTDSGLPDVPIPRGDGGPADAQTPDAPEIICLPLCEEQSCGGPNGCGEACKTGYCGGEGQRCDEGTCICDGLSCPDGCCKEGRCFSGTADSHCGSSGAECVDCLLADGSCDGAGACQACEPDCAGKACGADNGCGGTCSTGSCAAGLVCLGGSCICHASSCPTGCCRDDICRVGTQDEFCGDAGGLCADCSQLGTTWGCSDQACVCQPDCTGKACGANDGCGGSCSTGSCGSGLTCVGGSCVCNATSCAAGCCQGDVCHPGTDPNLCGRGGGVCAQCSLGDICSDQACACQPDCASKTCGADDSCGGICDQGSCYNGGQCVATEASCVCPPGYDGQLCETNIDDCQPNPCQNGGTCVDGVDEFTCNCTSAFTGPVCATCVPTTQNADFMSLGTFTTSRLDFAQGFVDGSAAVNVLNANGLGIVGGFSDNIVDGSEWIEFHFDKPASQVVFLVQATGDWNGNAQNSDMTIELYDPTGALLETAAAYVAAPFNFALSDFASYSSIGSVRLIPAGDYFRIGRVTFAACD